ncbi:PREDICTED: WSCD family member CG9164-like [Amphimedon queenslandica]|uniref:Sulfotransferase domain-containing protein n=1 Tax=Amphimedon queenslandica TaxID=400682 RepID=A0AAN0IP75_AMPQE|nr:PREDICTED: WSCD family member CG9164-like [Amphimedon queenslandica]|eukprot:XP_011405846.2 PREDICTED: WSCD family member CG9164-like [Amphimedon queenslandica]
MVLKRGMALLRRTRRKGIVLLAIICISSSTLLRIFIQGERMYNQYYQESSQVIRSGPAAQDLDLQLLPKTLPTNNSRTESLYSSLYPCNSKHCLDRLSTEDFALYNKCTNSAAKRGPVLSFGCHFINGSRRSPVALVSFPGSGNTWVRGLLELATSICTGSIYCDRELRAKDFTGEGLYSGSALVVKTHRYNIYFGSRVRRQKPLFSSAVFLVRDPFDALVSERNREVSKMKNVSVFYQVNGSSSHIGVVEEDSFGENKEWDRFVNIKINWWSKLIQYWVVNSSVPVLVVKFEDLKQDPVQEVKRILDFINYHQLTVEELSLKMKDGFNKYRRPKQKKRIKHFTKKQIETINHHIQLVVSQLRIKNKYRNNILSHYIRLAD